jgi:hypothetical protein
MSWREKVLHFKFKRMTWAEIIGYILVTSPILIYWFYWTFNPSYWFNGDPAAYYLVDSLSVFTGGSYLYVDHPGTPVQIVGTLLLALTYPFFDGRDAFINFYITKPEAFFLMTHTFLLVMNLFTAILLYNTARSTLSHDKVLGGIALATLFFPLHSYGFQSLTLWSHNSLNFPFGTLLLVWLYREIQTEQKIKKSILFLLGFASGILAIAQVYFFIWVATVAFTIFIYTWRTQHSIKQAISSSIYVISGNLLGISLMILPVYKEMPRFLRWFTNMVATEGIYGTGKRGFFTLAVFTNALNLWWDYLRPLTFVVLFTFAAWGTFAWLRKKSPISVSPSIHAMLAGLAIHMGLLLLILMKTAGKARYILSLTASLPILILLVLKLSETTFWEKLKFSRIVYALMLIGMVLVLSQQIDGQRRRAYVESDAATSNSQAITKLAQSLGVAKKEVVVVYAYAVPIQCSGMLSAMNWTGSFRKEITNMCPNQHAIYDTTIELNNPVPLVGITEIDWDMVVWPGNGSNLPEYLESVGAVNIPKQWHVHRSQWFFIHSDEQ